MIEKFGLQKSKYDHSVFYKNSQAGIILLVVYVDDIVISRNDMAGISSLKSFLHGQFHTKDLEMVKYVLGVEVMKSKREIFLSQRKYVLDLLSEIGKLAAKSCHSSMAQSLHLIREGKLFEDPDRYRRKYIEAYPDRQRKYVLDLLSEIGKLAAKSCHSSMAQSLHLIREGKLFEDPDRYRRLVGKLNYFTVTCPNIAYFVSVIS